MIYSFVSISAVQQSNLVIHIHIHSFFNTILSWSFPEVYISLYYTVGLLVVYLASTNSKLPVPPALTSSSRLAITSLFSMSVCLFVFYRYIHLCHILDYTYKWYHMVFVFLFLTTSLSMIISSYIHVSVNGIISFIFMAE